MKNRYFASFAALVATFILLLPTASNAQSSASITPDATCMTATSLGFPSANGGPACVLSHAAAFRLSALQSGSHITNVVVTKPSGVTPAAPACFSACVNGNSSRYTSDVTDVSVNVTQTNPDGTNDLVLCASGSGTLRVIVTTSSVGTNNVTTQNTTTQDVVIP